MNDYNSQTASMFGHKSDLIKWCKKNPGIVVHMDAGDGWYSVWHSTHNGKEPQRICMVNPEGKQLYGM